jgi:murein DD-endopeptidase MepM/ murein hydrolase activator NlpD
MRRSITRAIMVILLVCPVVFAACNDDDGMPRPPDTSFSAEEEFSFQIDVDGEDSFRVEGVRGNIEITGAQGATHVQVSGVKRVESNSTADATQRLSGLGVEHSKQQTDILVKTTQPKDNEGRNYIVNYTISLPKNLKVTVVNGDGGVIVQSLQNALTVTSGAGSITVTDIEGGVNLGQGAGPIDASVVLPLGESILINTGTGNIGLEIPQSTSATLSATVGVGSISVLNLILTNEVQETNSLVGTIGKGNGSIVLATSVGSIVITGSQEADQTARFPLDNFRIWQRFGNVNAAFGGKYHCAEDAYGKAGTPVYAIADGIVSYSGPMSGYGWLITINHPTHNVYSLYGHLSTRRSKIVDGVVRKGDVIAYLADDDEDGSGGDYPDWGPHLHFSIRDGGISDYPSASGDDRWMAGYTNAYPTGLGWLGPTDFILAHSE